MGIAHIVASNASWTLLVSVIPLLLAGCGANTSPAPQEDSVPPGLEAGPVEEIAGNEGHNLLARNGPFERAAGLTNVVKAVAAVPRCSAVRTMYLGQHNSDAFWSVECHTGRSYQVMISRAGSGKVLSCDTEGTKKTRVDCWEKWASKT